MAVDPKGLLALSMEEAWVDVPMIGDGGTLGYTSPILKPVHCVCTGCGSTWKLTECQAEIDITVYIQKGLFPGPNRNVRENEQQPVADWENDIELVADLGVKAEQDMRAKVFTTTGACEQFSSNAVTNAVHEGMRQISNISRLIWDISGRHNVWSPGSWKR